DMFCGSCGAQAGAPGHGGPQRPEPVQVTTMGPGAAWASAPPAAVAPPEGAGGTAWWRAGQEQAEVVPADPDQFFGHEPGQPSGRVLATVPTIAILVISLCLSFLPGVQWERRSLGVKVLASAVIAVVVVVVVLFYVVGSVFNGANGGSSPHLGPLATGIGTL